MHPIHHQTHVSFTGVRGRPTAIVTALSMLLLSSIDAAHVPGAAEDPSRPCVGSERPTPRQIDHMLRWHFAQAGSAAFLRLPADDKWFLSCPSGESRP